ncbi:MAG: hypothetical protein NC337_08070 [Roseburia sp.]|nr:hypothetical protein [Roseburia sp.]
MMSDYNMPLTLERHFENLSQSHLEVRELYSLWALLKKQIEEQLIHSSGVFASYSLHDKSHSLSVIRSVERLLGEERIRRLSATDTFMLLACIYAHDYGMAQTFNKIYDILGSDRFKEFVEEKERDRRSMETEDEWAIHNLFRYLNEKKADISLRDLYFSIMLVIQLYLRPMHWQGVIDIKSDYDGLFQGHLKKRFIYGAEGIVEICMCHGQSLTDLMKLSYRADGMIGDEYHPRFVAAMLRLGDLLDLDNGRFPMWFVRSIAQNEAFIPRLSVLHFRKHESVSHLLITPYKIEITAHCYTILPECNEKQSRQEEEFQREKAQRESFEVAGIVSDWTEQLARECRNMALNWKEIAQPDFGLPPAVPEVRIYVDGNEYMAENKALQMKMSQERVMKLLEGTNIYKDRYVGIREMIQNAVDASLLQLWNDLIQNRYSSCGLTREKVLGGFDLLDLLDREKASVFGNYDITVEVIEDRLREQVIIVVKDKGIGISTRDVGYIADIGSSKERNVRVRKLMDGMPVWLQPSGVFGIGLQSVFQLTDCIEFYTRQHNQPERQISLYSYGRNQGKIETRIVSEYGDALYYDNAIPGTNVKVVIDPRKFFDTKSGNGYMYYDPEFDSGEELHMIFEEISQVCKNKIREAEYDYFNICFDAIIIEKDGRKRASDKDGGERGRNCLRKSYIFPKGPGDNQGAFGENLLSLAAVRKKEAKQSHALEYIFADDKAFLWDKETCRCYRLTLRPCIREKAEGKVQMVLPQKVRNLYEISYKFNKISNTEAIYAKQDPSGHLHAGFLKLEVLILDDRPMDYMNIDRDRLREGAVDEDELLAVREEIVRRWCRRLCEEAERGIKSLENRYGNKPDILISLILTFYRNVSAEDFDRFIKLCWGMSPSWEIRLKGEGIRISELWNVNRIFQTGEVLPGAFRRIEERGGEKLHIDTPQFEALEKDGIGTEVLQVTVMDNISRLPHRMINIEMLRQEGNGLHYYLRLQAFDGKPRFIEMNKGACLHDYLSVIMPPEKKRKPELASLKGKVFKPDIRYRNLAVPCFPHTFRKGRNMERELDYCIKWYILSPFDKESTDVLAKDLADGRTELSEELKDAVMQSGQMRKCVSYIMKKRFDDCEDKAEQEKAVREEYEQFLAYFYEAVAENWKN